MHSASTSDSVCTYYVTVFVYSGLFILVVIYHCSAHADAKGIMQLIRQVSKIVVKFLYADHLCTCSWDHAEVSSL